LFSDYNAFRGSLKSALRRTFLTTEDTKGHKRAQSLNLHVLPDLSEGTGASPESVIISLFSRVGLVLVVVSTWPKVFQDFFPGKQLSQTADER